MTHTLKARQRCDRELAALADKIETLEARRADIDAELVDLRDAQRALLAMAVALRDAGGQL